MKKVLTILLVLLLSGCATSIKQEEEKEKVEPETFESSTTSIKETPFYVYPIADKDGNMVIPLSADCLIIATDEEKAEYMQKKFEETILFYHMILDPTHEFAGINNIKVINDNYGKGIIKVNSELIELLDSAITMSELTEGYFNPTIGSISSVWKPLFNESHKNSDPSSEDIENHLTASIPYNKLREYIVLDKENNTVEFKKLETTDLPVIIDLGAYAKGFVIDKCYNALLKYKAGFLISAGGSSIVCHVEPTQEKLGWVIGVKNPNTGNSCFQIKVKDSFISTSGDEEQFFINEEGIRRHHILNPYTGYPENNYRSITLIADGRADALDALSTALYNTDDVDRTIANVSSNLGITIYKAMITEDENKKLLLKYDQEFDEIYDVDAGQIKDISNK